MLLITLIALALVIVGIILAARRQTWPGVALIILGVLVFLLRFAIHDGANDTDALAVALMMYSQR